MLIILAQAAVTAVPTVATPTDWVAIIKAVFEGLVTLGVAYTAYTANKIHKLTNSGMTEQKRISWVSAETLAAATKEPGHIALAQEAHQVYEAALPKGQVPAASIAGIPVAKP